LLAWPPTTVASVRSPPLEIDVPMNSVAIESASEPHVIRRHVPDEVLMDVAGDDHGVRQPAGADEIEHGLSVEWIPAHFSPPRVRIAGSALVSVVGREGHLVGEQVPPGGRPVGPVDQPCLLRRTLDRPRRIERTRTVAV
jgi:hypothetical protein